MGDPRDEPVNRPAAAEAPAPGFAPLVCVSVDLDTTGCYRDIHGLPAARRAAGSGGTAGDTAYTVGVARMLELFEACGIAATLFVIGRDAGHPAHRELLAAAVAAGHEPGNHTHSHFYDLRTRPEAVQLDEIVRAEEAIEVACGRRPVGFRTPGYNVDEGLVALCRERGYLYDASVFPCPPYYAAKAAVMGWLSLRGRPSRSQMTRPEALLAPLTPYRPRRGAFWRRERPGQGSDFIEFPVAVVPGLRFPLIGTSLHLVGNRGFDALLPVLRRTHGQVLSLEFHAIDFMDARDPGVEDLVGIQPDLAVPWPTKRARYIHIFDRLRDHYRFETLETAATRWTGAAAVDPT